MTVTLERPEIVGLGVWGVNNYKEQPQWRDIIIALEGG